jgi:hypothetical protein
MIKILINYSYTISKILLQIQVEKENFNEEINGMLSCFQKEISMSTYNFNDKFRSYQKEQRLKMMMITKCIEVVFCNIYILNLM